MLKAYFNDTQIFNSINHRTFFKDFISNENDFIKKESKLIKNYKIFRDSIRSAYFNYLGSKCKLNESILFHSFDTEITKKGDSTDNISYHNHKRLDNEQVNYSKAKLTKINGEKIKKVLIFRYDAIGDYIITSPLIRWLRQAKPNLQIDIITSFRNDSIIRRDPLINNTYPIHPAKNYLTSWKGAINKAKLNDYDIIFGLVFTYMTKCALFAVSISPRSEKITIMHDTRSDIYGKVFNRQIEHHQWREHWATTMLRAGTESLHFDKSGDNKSATPYIYFYNEDIEEVHHLIKKYGLKYNINRENIFLPEGNNEQSFNGVPYCIINLSAYSPNRRISESKCSILCKMILSKFAELIVFVTGSINDKGSILAVVDTVGSARCLPLFMKLSEFVAFTAGASFIISPDTATIHIAAAAKVPVIGLYAELIKVAEWYPLNTNFAIVLSPDPYTINAIDNNKVLEAISLLYS
jgi:ADP-heptose:LPS heptosyltransferase